MSSSLLMLFLAGVSVGFILGVTAMGCFDAISYLKNKRSDKDGYDRAVQSYNRAVRRYKAWPLQTATLTCRSLQAERDALQRKCDQLQAACKGLIQEIDNCQLRPISDEWNYAVVKKIDAARAAIANVEGK